MIFVDRSENDDHARQRERERGSVVSGSDSRPFQLLLWWLLVVASMSVVDCYIKGRRRDLKAVHEVHHPPKKGGNLAEEEEGRGERVASHNRLA